MFIYNLKINSKLLFKLFLITCFAIVLGILIYVLIKFSKITKLSSNSSTENNENSNQKETFEVQDSIPRDNVLKIPSNNYTNVLKATHDNINNYIGTNINLTGYVYRIYGFKDNEFVIARNMIISSDMQYVVVGFLCNSQDISNYPNNTWINVTGTITKGTYNNKEIPILDITNIEPVKEPTDALVYPPDQNYIPTANMF